VVSEGQGQRDNAEGQKGYYSLAEFDRVLAEMGFGRDGSFYSVTFFLVPEKFHDITNGWMP
jgi:hypothetical protein